MEHAPFPVSPCLSGPAWYQITSPLHSPVSGATTSLSARWTSPSLPMALDESTNGITNVFIPLGICDADYFKIPSYRKC